MSTQSTLFDEGPPLEGADYVALVIEWDDLADDLERQLHAQPLRPRPVPPVSGTLIAAGALVATVLAWRILRFCARQVLARTLH